MPKTNTSPLRVPLLSKPFTQTVHIVQHKKRAVIAVLGIYDMELKPCHECKKPFLTFEPTSTICLDCAQDLPTQDVDDPTGELEGDLAVSPTLPAAPPPSPTELANEAAAFQ